MKASILFLISSYFFALNSAKAVENDSTYLPVIEIVGNKFFDSVTGEQFFMKGIAYQPSRSIEMLESAIDTFETKYIDPLADPNICLRDIPYLKKLNINTIRVYAIDPTKSHDICMEAFQDAGIYILLDLAEPDTSIARDSPTWDVNIWKRYVDVIDSMHGYSNMLGLFAGNEVTNDKSNTDASPFVKAAIRDVKEYIKAKGYRSIPVGYSSNDDADTRDNLAKYFSCGEISADFYGINMYEWCGYSSYGTSGYRERTKEFQDYSIPVFFSEFGCNLVRPRPFTEVGAMFGSKMSTVWSGGLVYMYFEEENEYGVVEIDKFGGVKELDDYSFLQNEFKNANPKGISKTDYMNSIGYKKLQNVATCPDSSSNSNWEATNVIPPTPTVKKCSCLENVLPCLVLPFQDNEKYEEYFNYICSQVDCSDIKADGKNGEYGEYSTCSVNQKLALQISKLYYKTGSKINQCPLTDKNVYFNIKSQKIAIQNGRCSEELLEEIKNAVSMNTEKSSKKSHKNKTIESPVMDNSSNSSQITLTRCIILFISAIVAASIF